MSRKRPRTQSFDEKYKRVTRPKKAHITPSTTKIVLHDAKKPDVFVPILSEVWDLIFQFGDIDLSYCKSLTDLSLQHIKSHSYLINLRLFHAFAITNAGLEHLKNLTQLTHLDLCRLLISEGLTHLSRLTSLRSLNLEDCTRVDNMALSNLTTLTQLTDLDLGSCFQISDEALAYVRKLTNLRCLILNQTKVTNDIVSSLLKLTKLEVLDVKNTSVSVEGLRGLTSLQQLVHIVTDVNPREMLFLDQLGNENRTPVLLELSSRLVKKAQYLSLRLEAHYC